MGFTRYYTRHTKEFNQNTWNSFIADCKYLAGHLPEHTDTAGGYCVDEPLAIAGCFRYKTAKFTKNYIWFNGSSGKGRTKDDKGYWRDVDNNDLGHETFVLMRKSKDNFGFCKTARKPYDLLVVACLVLAKWYFKEQIEINSDGEDSDYQSGIDFIVNTLPDGWKIITQMKLTGKIFN